MKSLHDIVVSIFFCTIPIYNPNRTLYNPYITPIKISRCLFKLLQCMETSGWGGAFKAQSIGILVVQCRRTKAWRSDRVLGLPGPQKYVT